MNLVAFQKRKTMEPNDTEPSQGIGLSPDARAQSVRAAHQGTPLPDGDRGTRQKATEEETLPDKQTCIIFPLQGLDL